MGDVSPAEGRAVEPWLGALDDARIPWLRGFCFVDTEASGFGRDACLIELGAVTDDGLSFESKIAPTCEVHPKAAEVNGYTSAEWEGAPALAGVLTLFETWADGRVVVGHNIWRYDFPLLCRAVGEARARKLLRASVDTLELAKAVMGPSGKHTLQACCAHYGIPEEGVHRALGGAQRVRALFGCLAGGRRAAVPVRQVQRVEAEF